MEIYSAKVLTMRIRAHHLLCIQGFQGRGYSKDFIDNMRTVIKKIKLEPEIEIIDSGDVICSSCPHNENGRCQKKPNSVQRVKNMDLQVLKKIGLNKGAKVKTKNIFSLVNKKFKYISDTKEICDDCEWKGECFWIKIKRF